MAQAPGTGGDHAPAGRRRRRGLELGGLAIGLAAGVGIALAWLVPARAHSPAPAALSTRAPVLVPGSPGQPGAGPAEPDPAALDAEWADYSDHSTCADWAGGDGVSALQLDPAQLAWFFSDTYIGPAGPAIGFSRLSGFVHNSVVVQTATGHGSMFVTVTGGGACTGPGRPGDALPVVGAPSRPGAPSDRYWEEGGLTAGGTIVKFYDHYRAGGPPFVPVGTVIATFQASKLSAAGRGGQYGAVARPALVPLPSWTPPSGGTPVMWGAALLRAGSTVYVYGTQSPDASLPGLRLYLARVPVSQLAVFSAWQFYAGAGRWAARQRQAAPVQPATGPSGLSVPSGFSVISAGQRYWLIQAGTIAGDPGIYAYPASAPWGPFDTAARRVLYRDPAIGLDPAHDYRIMYEARAEPALSTSRMLVISYNVNSEAVTTGCVPMSAFTNTVTLPRFIAVPLAAFGAAPGGRVSGVTSGPPDYPRIVPRDPSQWFDALAYPGGCPPVPGLAAAHARPAAGRVTLSWPDAGLGVRYLVYLDGPGRTGASPVKTEFGDSVTVTGLRRGDYQATVVPANFKKHTGPGVTVTFAVP